MTDRLDLRCRHRRRIEALLAAHVPDTEVWAYGSRVNGGGHEASDLDLVLRGPNLGPIPRGRMARLDTALEQSNIPIVVQTLDWARLPQSFRDEIEKQYVVLRAAPQPSPDRQAE